MDMVQNLDNVKPWSSFLAVPNLVEWRFAVQHLLAIVLKILAGLFERRGY
ncbi:MAG: hypothetical protein K9J37_15120 [Saprospiraceae bacterium]|nr:hypothetical protein [Saprospiraceae bacterium]MCF8251241.1 hypothetical protein [Saprospiraceae bacterium]MCF8282992.1 hypothetical protein [Bacteroidales bacterium]MCF8313135.1 hypothetical protein [Saprospiraceae bacterium]MCF8441603.1 hypothetical protein [Saprospiraceae bacterium]